MRASAVSAPIAVVRTWIKPSPLTAPPVTRLPACLATGRLSPVISDSSAWVAPCTTSPSTAMRSPGRTTTMSPTRTAASATSDSTPSRSTRAVGARSACKARMAPVVWRLARASRYLPSSTSVMTTADASKYRCSIICESSAAAASHRYTDKPYAAEVPSATSKSMLPLPALSAPQPAR